VTLTITYPGGITTVLKTITDANGFYSFGNLLLDENFDGWAAVSPLFHQRGETGGEDPESAECDDRRPRLRQPGGRTGHRDEGRGQQQL